MPTQSFVQGIRIQAACELRACARINDEKNKRAFKIQTGVDAGDLSPKKFNRAGRTLDQLVAEFEISVGVLERIALTTEVDMVEFLSAAQVSRVKQYLRQNTLTDLGTGPWGLNCDDVVALALACGLAEPEVDQEPVEW